MSVSVRTRFEVFKRDRFTCSYCGRTPPEVLLEADHIIPRAAGGSDDIANLTTACATCNRGKAARLLEEGTAPVVGRATVEELAERVSQAQAYMEVLGGLESVVDRQVEMIYAHWAKAFRARTEESQDGSRWVLDGYGETWPNEPSVRRFLRSLTLEEVLEGIDIAAAKMNAQSGTHATRYFYGVCHRAIREGRAPGAPAAPAATGSFDDGYQAGVEAGRAQLRELFQNYEEHGYASLRALVDAIWPEDA